MTAHPEKDPSGKRVLSLVPSDREEPVSRAALSQVDREVGLRLRAQRTALGYTPTQLAETLGVPEYEIEEYEVGRRRVQPREIIALGRILGVPITYFFEGILDNAPGLPDRSPISTIFGGDYLVPANSQNGIPGGDVLELLSIFLRIGNPARRAQALSVLRAIAAEDDCTN